MGTVAPYGSWPSPLSAGLIATSGVRLGELRADGDDLYWLEARPTEGGRSVVVHASGDVTPAEFNARTLAHEYGGGAYAVRGGAVVFSNFEDQRVYLQRQDASAVPVPITAEPSAPRSVRFADFEIDVDLQQIYCVRETHGEEEPRNELVRLRMDGTGEPETVITGHDFVSYPRLSPDGRRLAFTTWTHPRMPWDGTELWVARVDGGEVSEPRRIAGGPDESIFQPAFSPGGVLHWVSDRSGWWNLYNEQDGALAPLDAEFGRAQWGFAMTTYAFLPDGRLVCTWQSADGDHLGALERGALREIDTPYRSFGGIVALGGARVGVVAASPTEAPAVATVDVDTGAIGVHRRSHALELDPAGLSEPEPLAFPSAGGRTAHALYYAPRNATHDGPADERPPLVVFSHGGPTGATSAALNLGIQFWTSRGIAVVDVNYGGSTGYGREYRNLLRGGWGVVDVEDCIAAARYLVERGSVDGERLAIRGGSAGGYTTLCALTFHDLFAAGASYYGVADAEALARDTHKFESRYLDLLIGPYPEQRERYRERSPIHFADRLSCPLLLLQGLEDAVVPPAQAEVMVEALAKAGLPHAYVPFEGEQHGFRKAENIARAAEAELYFYGRVLDFTPAGSIEPIEIANAEGLPGEPLHRPLARGHLPDRT